MFDNFNVNLRKNKGFLTSIQYIPIPEYGHLNAPLVSQTALRLIKWRSLAQGDSFCDAYTEYPNIEWEEQLE